MLVVFNQVLPKADAKKVRLVIYLLGRKSVMDKEAGESEWVKRAPDYCAALREARPGKGTPKQRVHIR